MPLPIAPKRSKNTKMVSVRLSGAAIDMLHRLTEMSNMTQTQVIEHLIVDEMKFQEESRRATTLGAKAPAKKA